MIIEIDANAVNNGRTARFTDLKTGVSISGHQRELASKLGIRLTTKEREDLDPKRKRIKREVWEKVLRDAKA